MEEAVKQHEPVRPGDLRIKESVAIGGLADKRGKEENDEALEAVIRNADKTEMKIAPPNFGAITCRSSLGAGMPIKQK